MNVMKRKGKTESFRSICYGLNNSVLNINQLLNIEYIHLRTMITNLSA